MVLLLAPGLGAGRALLLVGTVRLLELGAEALTFAAGWGIPLR